MDNVSRENDKENPKLFDGILKKVRQKKQYSMINTTGNNGNIITEESEIMDRWRKYFEQLTYSNTVQQKQDKQKKHI